MHTPCPSTSNVLPLSDLRSEIAGVAAHLRLISASVFTEETGNAQRTLLKMLEASRDELQEVIDALRAAPAVFLDD